MQRHGDLAGTQIGPEMASDLPHGVDQQLAHLLGQRLELLVTQLMKVLRLVDAVE